MSDPCGGYIYIGGYQPSPDILYLKAGRSHQPKARTKSYGTMLPGGLAFMRAALVPDSPSAERALMAALLKVDSVVAVGGEWFKCDPFMRLAALDELHKLSATVISIRPYCPTPFGCKRTKKHRRVRK